MRKFVSFAASATVACGLVVTLMSAPASATPGQTGKGIPVLLTFAPMQLPTQNSLPVAGLNPPFGPSLDTLPGAANCPFDASPGSSDFLGMVGNGVEHVSGKNGLWWGETITTPSTGFAALITATDFYTGHATGWTGLGTNGKQAEVGLTLDFHGVDGAGNSLSVHINWHITVPNLSSHVPSAFVENMSCGA